MSDIVNEVDRGGVKPLGLTDTEMRIDLNSQSSKPISPHLCISKIGQFYSETPFVDKQNVLWLYVAVYDASCV